MNNSDVNTGKLVADVINHRSSNHLDKYDLEKVKTGLTKGRYATQSTERHAFWRRPPTKVRMSVWGVWLVAAVVGSCKHSAAFLTNGTYQNKVAREKEEKY